MDGVLPIPRGRSAWEVALPVALAALALVLALAAVTGRFGVNQAYAPVDRVRTLSRADHPAARTALVALRGTTSRGAWHAPYDRVRLAPDGPVLTDAQAAAQLDALRKPVRCQASASDAALLVTCARFGPPARGSAELDLPAVPGEVGVMGAREVLRIPAVELERFFVDYRLEGRRFEQERRPISLGHPELGVRRVHVWAPVGERVPATVF